MTDEHEDGPIVTVGIWKNSCGPTGNFHIPSKLVPVYERKWYDRILNWVGIKPARKMLRKYISINLGQIK